MKKIIVLLFLLPTVVLAQKFKTKKEKVLIDEKEVAILNDKVRDQYEFLDLNNVKQFTAQYKSIAEGQTIINQWLELTSADGKIKTEIPYEVLITSFSSTKILLHLLSVKYELFDSNGFNQKKIADFFAIQRESISDKTLKAKIELVSSKKDKQDKIARYQPFVKNDGTIMFGGTVGTNIVGKAIGSSYTPLSGNSTVQIYDLDNVLVANAKIKDNADNQVIVDLFNDSNFTYNSQKRYSSVDNSMFFKELVGELVYRDITLGHQAKSYNQKIIDEKIKLAKERSANVYNVKGYAIDEKGVRYEGIITAQFEKLDINQTGDNQVVDAIDNYGKNVIIKYLNEKGKERLITLTAKENAVFYVKNNDGTYTCYKGMKVKGDAMKKLSNAMSLGFNNAYFYKVLFSEKENDLLVDPVEKERYVIKLKSQNTGQMIDNRNNKNLSKELSEYLASCKNISNEILKEEFDLKIEENLINIIKEFNSCN